MQRGEVVPREVVLGKKQIGKKIYLLWEAQVEHITIKENVNKAVKDILHMLLGITALVDTRMH